MFKWDCIRKSQGQNTGCQGGEACDGQAHREMALTKRDSPRTDTRLLSPEDAPLWQWALKSMVKAVDNNLPHNKTMNRGENILAEGKNSLFILIFLQFTSNISSRKAIFSIPLYYIQRNDRLFKLEIFFPRKHMSMCGLDFQLSPQLSEQVLHTSS